MEPGKPNHVICAKMDHNSVLRPVSELRERGWATATCLAVDPATGQLDPADVRKAVRPETRLIALTHASNVTGVLQPIRAIGRIARECGVPMVVDAAQSLGHVPLDVREDFIDLLAAPGHKGLLGPLGTGFLYIRPGIEKRLRTLREGGTGSVSELDVQPDFLPDRFEPGSHNAIGIIGLSEGVAWLLEQTIGKICDHDGEMLSALLDGISDVEGITCYGPPAIRQRVGVVSVRVEGMQPAELSAILESSYGILTRSGLHCAPLAHETIGTLHTGGTTRLSFGPFLDVKDVQYAAEALTEIALSKTLQCRADRG
jgi:selenocysteine lyase/cysteine desulfurase